MCSVIETETHHKSNKFILMKKFIIRLLAIVLIGAPFVDTAERKARRLSRSSAPVGTAVALGRPLPWNDPGFNLKQPAGNQVMRAPYVRPLVRARAGQQ
jgi:hypothetical protein